MQICTVLNFTRIKRPVSVALPAVCGAGFMQLSGTHLSIPSGCHTPLRRVCCCGPGEQEILMNCCMACSSSNSGRTRVVHVVSVHRKPNTDWFLSKTRRVLLHLPPWGGGTLSDTAIRPPVCPSLGYAGCLQLAGHEICVDCRPPGR